MLMMMDSSDFRLSFISLGCWITEINHACMHHAMEAYL